MVVYVLPEKYNDYFSFELKSDYPELEMDNLCIETKDIRDSVIKAFGCSCDIRCERFHLPCFDNMRRFLRDEMPKPALKLDLREKENILYVYLNLENR